MQQTTKTSWFLAFLMIGLIAFIAWLAFQVIPSACAALTPPVISLTNATDDVADANINDTTYYTGENITFNGVIWSGTNGGFRQNLTNLTVLLRVGSSSLSILHTGTVQVVTAGTWTASAVQFPIGNTAPRIQVTLRDTNNVEKTFPRGQVSAVDVW